MPPSVRGAGTRTRKVQPTLLGYTKITKPTTGTRARKGVKHIIENSEHVSKYVQPEVPATAAAPVTPATNSRKRARSVSEAEETDAELILTGKRVKVFPLTPPSSDHSGCSSPENASSPCVRLARFSRSPSPPSMPQGLEDLRAMHKFFIKAFSFHRAHNGTAAPAELHELMQSMTRLYKKSSIRKEDIQRMLAIYEVDEKPEIAAKTLLQCSKSPFKLITSGVGSNKRDFIEFIGIPTATRPIPAFEAKNLHTEYSKSLDLAFLYGRRINFSFINGPVADYPLLAFAVGPQTAARQHKATELRKHVLNKSVPRAGSPELGNLSIHDPDSPPRSSAIKARTLSLFERIKSKQAIAAATPIPTSAEVLRQHALDRLDEVVEILKMKQHQKLSFEVSGVGSAHETPDTPLRRVSFTVPESVRMVKESLSTAISEDVLRCCIEILATEAPGFWCRRIMANGTLCVVLQGRGPVGMEVKTMLKAKEGHVQVLGDRESEH